MAKIIHYRKKCIGCAICFEMQPDIWRMSQRDGKAMVVLGEQKKECHIRTIHAGEVYLSQLVAKACPVQCIQVS